MKLHLALAIAYTFICFSTYAQLTTQERNRASQHLLASQELLLLSVKNLSAKQLSFKPAADRWSIEECVEHLAIAEKALFGIIESGLVDKDSSSHSDQTTLTDDEVIAVMEDRTKKFQTSTDAQPTNRFGGLANSLAAFQKERKSNIEFIMSTSDDLRRYYVSFPYGRLDLYQVMLLISSHTNRHIAQINEVKAHPAFP